MKSRRHSTEQINGILKEAEFGYTVKEVKKLCRKNGFSDAIMYSLKSKYGGLTVSDSRQVGLKRSVVDQAIEIRIFKEITSKKWFKTGQERVDHRERGIAVTGVK